MNCTCTVTVSPVTASPGVCLDSLGNELDIALDQNNRTVTRIQLCVAIISGQYGFGNFIHGQFPCMSRKHIKVWVCCVIRCPIHLQDCHAQSSSIYS